jgi:ABC-type sulfate transport system permease component
MEFNMQTESEARSLAPETRSIGNTIRLTGWITFWVQLGLAVVSGLVLLFAYTGRGLTEQPNAGLGVGIFWAVCGVVVLLFSVYWDFRYTRIGKSLENPNPALHSSKADTTKIIRLGVFLSLVGVLLTLLGAGATVAVLVAKSISQPPGVAITDPYKIIRALDVFVVLANINGIAAHFIGTVTSLWLLERVHQH